MPEHVVDGDHGQDERQHRQDPSERQLGQLSRAEHEHLGLLDDPKRVIEVGQRSNIGRAEDFVGGRPVIDPLASKRQHVGECERVVLQKRQPLRSIEVTAVRHERQAGHHDRDDQECGERGEQCWNRHAMIGQLRPPGAGEDAGKRELEDREPRQRRAHEPQPGGAIGMGRDGRKRQPRDSQDDGRPDHPAPEPAQREKLQQR